MSQPNTEYDTEEFGALTSAYVLTLTRQLAELEEMLACLSEREDRSVLTAAERLAHRIAGTAGTFGFSQASALAQDIESALRMGGLGPNSEGLAAFVKRLSVFREAFRQGPSG